MFRIIYQWGYGVGITNVALRVRGIVGAVSKGVPKIKIFLISPPAGILGA